MADQVSSRQDRYSSSEIRHVPTVEVKELRRQTDKASKDFRELDSKIQQKNWATELIEASKI
ncbi:hypothetical protein [Corynebacterium lactis]|uniref:DIP1984 family protein n=1 Tax=Corynebacterium lactis TaxID=1231000 RepID=UPI000A641FD4|nr:hypothetical protein [Corynebacterium lactis]